MKQRNDTAVIEAGGEKPTIGTRVRVRGYKPAMIIVDLNGKNDYVAAYKADGKVHEVATELNQLTII